MENDENSKVTKKEISALQYQMMDMMEKGIEDPFGMASEIDS